MNAMEILVIILSIFLAIFLLAGIILAVLLIRITRQIRRVTSSAEKTALNIENVSSAFAKYSSPVMVGKLFADQFKKHRKSKEK